MLEGQAILTAAGKPMDDDILFANFLKALPSSYELEVRPARKSSSMSREDILSALRMRFHELQGGKPSRNKEGQATAASAKASKGGASGSGRRDAKGGEDADVSGDDVVTCGRCGKRGHGKADCRKHKAKANATEAENPGSTTTVATATTVTVSGKSGGCSRVDVWLADSGATHHMTPVRDRLYDFRPCTDEDVDLAGGSMSIKGRGKLNVRFLSGTGEDVSFALSDVAYVPTFSKNLFSLQAAARNGHEAIVNENGTSLMYGRLHSTKYRDLHALKAYRLLPHTEANATIAPGLQYRSTYDINHFHCSYGHLHEALLRDTARQLGVKLTGELQPC